jgi:sporulation protein YlmC with PRC-barrel domain
MNPMLVYAEQMIGTKAEHDAAPLNSHVVNDILFNKYDHRLCYFTFSEENNEQDYSRGDDHMETVVAATSGMNSYNTPLTGGEQAGTHVRTAKETYFIPWNQVVEMKEERIVFTGNERQLEEPLECYSFLALKDWTVIDQNNEKVGKIKDLVIDSKSQQVVGFMLSEGFWKSLLGSDEKFMPIIGAPDWTAQEWKIEQTPDVLLRNSPDQL